MVYKLYCIFSKESVKKMNGIRGKMCTQAGHAYLHAIWDAMEWFPESVTEYREGDHAFKITLITDTDDELRELELKYRAKCGTTVVVDKGFTVFKEPTLTCIGIGPIREDMIGDDLKALKLFN